MTSTGDDRATGSDSATGGARPAGATPGDPGDATGRPGGTGGGPGSFVVGLCSVTLRACPPEQVIDVGAASGVVAVEWGGDVHVPPGDLAHAEHLAARTTAAGLAVGSYGSYLFADAGLPDDEVGRVVDTAEAIGAPWLRVWCPFGIEPGAPPRDRARVVAGLARIAERAAVAGLRVYVEFHGRTLTATEASVAALLAEVGAPTLFGAWQPPYWDPSRPVGRPGDDVAADLAGIAQLGPRLAHVHVYVWDHDLTRSPLAAGAAAWPARLDAAAAAGGAVAAPRLALLEFVPGDDPGAVAAEAATLRSWLAGRSAAAGAAMGASSPDRRVAPEGSDEVPGEALHAGPTPKASSSAASR